MDTFRLITWHTKVLPEKVGDVGVFGLGPALVRDLLVNVPLASLEQITSLLLDPRDGPVGGAPQVAGGQLRFRF